VDPDFPFLLACILAIVFYSKMILKVSPE